MYIRKDVRDTYWRSFPINTTSSDVLYYHIAGADMNVRDREVGNAELLDYIYRFTYEKCVLGYVIKNKVKGRHSALDCGAGTGRNTLTIARFFDKVDAFDVSGIFISKNKEKFGHSYPQISFSNNTFEDVALPERYYDFIFVGGVFMCMDDNEVMRALKKIRSALVPGGFLLVRDTLSKYEVSLSAENGIKIYRSEKAYKELFQKYFSYRGAWDGANRNFFISFFKRLPKSFQKKKWLRSFFSSLIHICLPVDLFLTIYRQRRHSLADQRFYLWAVPETK